MTKISEIKLIGILAGTFLPLLLLASEAKAFIVTIGGMDYDVTIFQGSPDSANPTSSKFAAPANGGTMPWWGNPALATQFATEVGTYFTAVNQPPIPTGTQPLNIEAGPLFASSAGEPVVAAFYNYTTVQIDQYTDFDFFATLTYAEVLPAPVPGPLPLFGAAVAFRWSRRLRRQVKACGGRR